MEESETFKGRTPGPAQEWGRDRRRPAATMGTVKVHGTVPGSGTMRRVGEVFAMRPVTRDGTRYEE